MVIHRPPANNDPPKIHVNIQKLPNVKCETCGCETFFNTFRFKIVPAIQSKTGKDDPLASSTWTCTNCRKENKELRSSFKEVTKMLLEQIGAGKSVH